MPANEPLEYAIPEQRRRRRPPALWAHIRLTIGAFGAWLVVCAILMLIVPRLAMILHNFTAELPALTKNVLWASRAMRAGGWFSSLVIPIGIVALGILIDAMSKTAWPVRLYSIVMTLLLMVAVAGFAVLVFAALYAPIMATLEQF